MHFQEFWVSQRGTPEVKSVVFTGLEKAIPSQSFLDLLEREESVLIGPSNPVTSIGPILALPGVLERLRDKKILAISPLVGGEPVSGPAAKFMRACGVPADDSGVAKLLGRIDVFVVDKKSSYSGDCIRMNTLMKTKRDSLRLARDVLELI
jgi:LPPG:FO 2-phospho-L-lactate transferase